MINEWLNQQEDIVLARLASIKPTKWNSMIGHYQTTTGDQGCLICHAFNVNDPGKYLELAHGDILTAELKYMHRANESSQRQAGVEVSAQAEKILTHRYIAPIIDELIAASLIDRAGVA